MRPRSFSLLARAVMTVCIFGAMLAPLASADGLNSFAVLAGSTVKNAGAGVLGATTITGNMGVSPGTACTLFVAGTGCTLGPGMVTGTVDLGNAVSLAAQNELTTLFNTESTLPTTASISGGVLTGLSLGPGVYAVGAGTLAGTLTLSDGGVPGSIFVFELSSLTTSPGSSINVVGLSPGDSLYWVDTSSATLGDNTVFFGNILASTSISFDPGATDLCGRALAETGEVSFAGQDATSGIENQVSIGCVGTPGAGGSGFNGLTGTGTGPTPEPATLLLLGSGFAGSFIRKVRTKRAKARRA